MSSRIYEPKSNESPEAGGSVFELIEFSLERTLADGTKMMGRYGVNVAKVREVVRMPVINPLGSRQPGIAGVFELRGVPIPAVNLCQVLGDSNPVISDEHQIIVVEFSNKRAGFIVSSTHSIRRVTWEHVLPPSADQQSCMTGMILVENNEFLFILDLERILSILEREAAGSGAASINSDSVYGQDTAAISPQKSKVVVANGFRVLIVDDSPIILEGIKSVLQASGFEVKAAINGADALTVLEESLTTDQGIDILITDVEMPQMDGMTLTRKVREHPVFAELPVIFHSSLSGEATMSASMATGANGYVVKNDLVSLVALTKRLLQIGDHHRSA